MTDWKRVVVWGVIGAGCSSPPGGSASGVDASLDVAEVSRAGADVAIDVATDAGAYVTTDTGVDENMDTGADVRTGPTTPSCPVPTERGCGSVAIPGGTYTMGGDVSAFGGTPAQPSITVSGFALDAYEVTVARFRRFWTAGHPAATSPLSYPGGTVTWTGGGVTVPSPADGYCTWTERTASPSLDAHPINCVDWYTAQAFCVWDGGRLPTEAEWEYAARGTSLGGLTPERSLPWGNTLPSHTCDLAEWDDCPGDDGARTKRVGSFPASAGLFDLAGNVYEWAADAYAPYTDATCWGAVRQNNPVCGNRTVGARVIRGGAGDVTDVAVLRSASRSSSPPTFAVGDSGFRCAREL